MQIPFLLFSSLVGLGFLVCSIFLLGLGRRLGARHIAHSGDTTMAGLSATESAVLALMGLIMAFTISGALNRFDERKQLIVSEANAISTAYDRMSLLLPADAQELRAKVKEYLQARIGLYSVPHGFSVTHGAAIFPEGQVARIQVVRNELWIAAVGACSQASIGNACALILPALNTVFDVARQRTGANERHPPQVLYVMLFALGLGGSLLAGYSMGALRGRSWAHMTIFASALALALFIVTDLEFPTLGLITVSYFDHFLVDLLNTM